MSAGVPATLLDRAQAWLADDPDPATREELRGVLDAAGRGKPRAEVDLADRFAGTLEFGTAGLRGRIGAGPNRMNRAVVIRAAAGLTAYLQQARPDPLVVIGYDARHRSADFATDTAAVVVGAGARAALLPGPLPTPVLAYAIRHLGADAGVMVTASHNPPQDNGYKVYLGDGSQIVAPADARIAERITAVPSVAGVARAERGWEVLGPQLRAAYVAACVMVVAPESAREIRVVHTALHGVGGALVRDCFEAAGFAAPVPVSSQQDPDPDFPTVPFPNPEEPGVMGAAFATAARVRPDIVIASDPDADRCAVGVPDSQAPGGWRMLHGDEVGALLGAHILARGVEPGRVLASSVVSSRLLGVLAKAAGVGHRETLTGFKWISRVPGLRYGYEEALGYCVAPEAVRDKDGISAALLVAELAAGLRSQGRTLVDRLDDLARTHGLYVSDALAVRVADLGLLGELMDRLRSRPPQRVGEAQVSTRQDLRDPAGDLPPTDALRYHLADGSRVIVRPSGTEPKLKVYLEAVVPVLPAGSVADARSEAARRLGAMRASMRHLLDGAAPAPAASHQRQHHREQEQHTATGE